MFECDLPLDSPSASTCNNNWLQTPKGPRMERGIFSGSHLFMETYG
jgi:hypothetical protein